MGEAVLAVDPRKVCLFIPKGLKNFKLNLFERIGREVGRVIRHNVDELAALPDDVTPIVGCMPETRHLIDKWMMTGRTWVYWDRGYFRRIFATDLPRGDNGGYYRWTIGAFQMRKVYDVPADRWRAQQTDLLPWARDGKHIVVASPSPTYERFHKIEGWTERTVAELKKYTDRPLVTRDKEMQRAATDRLQGGRRLYDDCKGAHCLVTHGSNAAVEAAIMGCPVFVDECSAAVLVGKTNLVEIEEPVYPNREPWMRSLAYNQFNEQELVDGTLWKLLQ